MRKVTKTKSVFPSDQALLKLLLKKTLECSNVQTFQRSNVPPVVEKRQIPNLKFQFSNHRNGFRIKSGMTVSVDETLDTRDAFSFSPRPFVSLSALRSLFNRQKRKESAKDAKENVGTFQRYNVPTFNFFSKQIQHPSSLYLIPNSSASSAISCILRLMRSDPFGVNFSSRMFLRPSTHRHSLAARSRSPS